MLDHFTTAELHFLNKKDCFPHSTTRNQALRFHVVGDYKYLTLFIGPNGMQKMHACDCGLLQNSHMCHKNTYILCHDINMYWSQHHQELYSASRSGIEYGSRPTVLSDIRGSACTKSHTLSIYLSAVLWITHTTLWRNAGTTQLRVFHSLNMHSFEDTSTVILHTEHWQRDPVCKGLRQLTWGLLKSSKTTGWTVLCTQFSVEQRHHGWGWCLQRLIKWKHATAIESML